MWTLRLVALLSCLIWARGDIEAYNDARFEQQTKTGKHFLQFWHPSCHDCLSPLMIQALFDIDTALGMGAEDIWVGRVELFSNPVLTKRFEITTTPTFVYVVGDKYYKEDPNMSLVTDDIVEYLRSGFLSEVAYDIPPAPSVPQIALSPWFSKFVDDVFGEPEIVFLERKSVTTLRRALLVVLFVIVALKGVLSRMKVLNKEKTE